MNDPFWTRRTFLATTALMIKTIGAEGNNDTRLNIMDYKAVGDGEHDDSGALKAAVFDSLYLNKELYLPAGNYFCKYPLSIDFEQYQFTSKTLRIRGAGASSTILVSNNIFDGEIDTGISSNVISLYGASSISIGDLSIHGKIDNPETYDGRRLPLGRSSSILNISGCSNIHLNNVYTSKGRHLRKRQIDGPVPDGRSGSVSIVDCKDVVISGCRLTYPTFTDGWWIIDCVRVHIDEFQYIGPSAFDKFAISTALNIIGPKSSDVLLENCRISNTTGSVVNIGGKGNFIVRNSHFSGFSIESGVSGRSKRPGPSAFGKGIDFGAEHQELLYKNHPELQNVKVLGCSFINLFSYSVRFNKTKQCPAYNIVMSNNRVAGSERGPEFRWIDDCIVSNNVIYDIIRTPSNRESGNALIIIDSSNVRLINNSIKGLGFKSAPPIGEGTIGNTNNGVYSVRTKFTEIKGNVIEGIKNCNMNIDKEKSPGHYERQCLD